VFDGLPSDEFNSMAVFWQMRDSLLFFGSTRGITFFNPHKIYLDTFYTRLIAYNLRTYRNYRLSKLYKTLLWPDEINMFGGDNGFVVSFYTLNYISPEKVKYKISLQRRSFRFLYGMSSLMFSFKTDTFYTNYLDIKRLPPGEYALSIETTNHEGSNVRYKYQGTLILRVFPAWWQSWILPFLFVLFFGYLVKWFTLMKLEKQQAELRRIERVAESFVFPFIIVSDKGIIKYYNKKFKSYIKELGFHAEDNLLGQIIESIVFPDNKEIFKRKFKQCVEKGQSFYIGKNHAGRMTLTILSKVKVDDNVEIMIVDLDLDDIYTYIRSLIHNMRQKYRPFCKECGVMLENLMEAIFSDYIGLYDFSERYLGPETEIFKQFKENLKFGNRELKIIGLINKFPYYCKAFEFVIKNLIFNAFLYGKDDQDVILKLGETADKFVFKFINVSKDQRNKKQLSEIFQRIEQGRYSLSNFGIVSSIQFVHGMGGEMVLVDTDNDLLVEIEISFPKNKISKI
jgi:hypothetical protein